MRSDRTVIARFIGPLLLLAGLLLGLPSTDTEAGLSSPAYQDVQYHSTVFGRQKFFRLYLPRGYDRSDRRYPVIYFFHGWGGRHFKDDNALLEYEKLKKLVDT
jgi:predicted peptidase